MAKPLTLENALALLAGGAKISDEARDLIAQKTAGRAVLHMTGSVLDVAETLSAIEFCDETGETSGGDGCKTLSEVLAKPSGLPACGITGRALRGNKTTTTPVIDYTNMIDLYRETLAYAADAGKIGTDLHAAEMAVYQIQVKPTPPPPWPGLIKEWTTIRDAQDPTPSQAAQKARVLSRLRFNKAAAPTPVSGMDLGRDMGTVVTEVERPVLPYGALASITDMPRPAPRPAPPMPVPTPTVGTGGYRPKVVILVADDSPRDEAMLRELIKHLGVGQRQIGYDIWATKMIEGGETIGAVFERQIQTADIFLYLSSADLFSGTIAGRYDVPQALHDRFPPESGYRHIPVLLRPVSVPAFLQGSVPLPSNGKPVTDWRDSDSAMGEIVRGLNDVIKGKINNPAARPRH